MNLEDLTDQQTTTKKMRAALRRGDDPKREVDRLGKKKNPNPSIDNGGDKFDYSGDESEGPNGMDAGVTT